MTNTITGEKTKTQKVQVPGWQSLAVTHETHTLGLQLPGSRYHKTKGESYSMSGFQNALPSQSDLSRWNPHSRYLFLPSLMLCLAIVLVRQALPSTALNHRDLFILARPSGHSQKAQRDGLKATTLLGRPAHTDTHLCALQTLSRSLCSQVWRLESSCPRWFPLGLFKTKCIS